MDSESETEGNQGRVGFGAEQYQCTATLVQYTVYLMLNYCSCATDFSPRSFVTACISFKSSDASGSMCTLSLALRLAQASSHATLNFYSTIHHATANTVTAPHEKRAAANMMARRNESSAASSCIVFGDRSGR